MAKINVKNAVAEHDGCEMTRIIWQWIREKPILPYLDITSGPATSAAAGSGAQHHTRKGVWTAVQNRHTPT